jgi:hypothetical protein
LTRSARAWEAARHALGRLFSRAAVYQVPEDQILPLATVCFSDALTPLIPTPGISENIWRAHAVVQPSSLTQIDVHISSEGSRPQATIVGESHVVASPECFAIPALTASALQIRQAGGFDAVQVVALPHSFIALPKDPLRLMSISVLSLPKATALGGFSLAKPKGKALIVPRRPAARLGPVRTGEVALSRIPLLRRGLQSPVGVPLSTFFSAEHRCLAETAGLPLSDVTLLGVYPAIPIIAVRRLVVEDEGRQLRLWLKPESWWGRPPPRRITLLIGRQSSTGKMLQASG